MKVALLLPGYLDSPDYLHLKIIDKKLQEVEYLVERLDPCDLWKTKNTDNYSMTNYLKQVEDKINFYKNQNPSDIILVGHSMGGSIAIIAGNKNKEVTKIVALCSSPDGLYSELEWPKNTSRQSIRRSPNNPDENVIFNVPYSFVIDRSQYSAIDEVKKINKPLMIFIALNDKVVSPIETEKIVASANHPYVVRQANMGHDFGKSVEQSNIVASKIAEFLSI